MMRLTALFVLAALAASTCFVQAGASDRCFGSSELRDGAPYAIPEGLWTFDQGPDSAEGWVADGVYDPQGADVIRWQTSADFVGDDLPPGAPIIGGAGMIWAGLHADEAEELCYECGLGYGYGIQRVQSPWIPYSGGDFALSFDYFLDMEDVSMLIAVTTDTDLVIWNDSFFGGGQSGSWSSPERFESEIQSSFPASPIRLSVYFIDWQSNGDEFCLYDSEFGAFGVDNIEILGGATAFFDFEGSAQAWETVGGYYNATPDEHHFEVHSLESYGESYEDWPNCAVQDNVMTFHGPGGYGGGRHLDGARSPIIDLSQYAGESFQGFKVTWDMLVDYPPGPSPGLYWDLHWRHYPVECSTTGESKWSNWEHLDREPIPSSEECFSEQVSWGNTFGEVPERVQIHMGVDFCEGCCPSNCEGAAFAPFFDNIQLCIRSPISSVPSDAATSKEWGARLSSQPAGYGTTLRFSGVGADRVKSLSLFDATGRRIAALSSSERIMRKDFAIGRWLNEQDFEISPGVYFVHIATEFGEKSLRMVWKP